MSFFTRIHASIFGCSSAEAKVGIIGISGVGKNTLLRRVAEGEIQTIFHSNKFLKYKKGQNYHLRMNFIMSYVGYDEPPLVKRWYAEQFCDSDGMIFVVDDDLVSRSEQAEWLQAYAKGFIPSHSKGNVEEIKVKEGVPWLILGNKKKVDSTMTVDEIERTMGLGELEIDLHIEVVNMTHSTEEIANAMKWLRKRIDTPLDQRLQMTQVK
ncbi:hypothetical protein BGW36DRAFT_439964 [Talaromyces proteolyticus]|uniref:Uncharacterized protein n=1 Tax=Talaromyces proteolyticus TaxID=1131652 RepID=A0AAD4KJH3_9EURO|nr:uncharacterized protein BGW36DRAFT_439964 [Talaromyces proteolyticus]KAH8690692.1 hypothetical protein BGW36DRAFT_439964 [Talaromyces proteolyticus]